MIFAVVVLANHVYRQPMDFRVYHFGARGVFNGTRPVYGLTSGLGWPMHYRYPPLFLLLFAPLALLPLGPAAVVWVLLKVVLLVWLGRKLSSTFPLLFSTPLPGEEGKILMAPILLIAPYLIEEFRY